MVRFNGKKAALVLSVLGVFAIPAAQAASNLHFERGVLVDGKGMTLYTFDYDQAGTSVCYEEMDCIKNWPAAIADGGSLTKHSGLAAKLSVNVRKTGEPQIALAGKPLYTFIMDKKPGDVLGDNANKVWHIVTEKSLTEISVETNPLLANLVFKKVPGASLQYVESNPQKQGADEYKVLAAKTEAFEMLETEVTQEVWEQVMGYSNSRSQGTQNPVDSVNGKEVGKFLQAINSDPNNKYQYMLPTRDQFIVAMGKISKKESNEAANDCPTAMTWGLLGGGGLVPNPNLTGSQDVKSCKSDKNGLYGIRGNVQELVKATEGNSKLEPAINDYKVFDDNGTPLLSFFGSQDQFDNVSSYENDQRKVVRDVRMWGELFRKEYPLGFRLVRELK